MHIPTEDNCSTYYKNIPAYLNNFIVRFADPTAPKTLDVWTRIAQDVLAMKIAYVHSLNEGLEYNRKRIPTRLSPVDVAHLLNTFTSITMRSEPCADEGMVIMQLCVYINNPNDKRFGTYSTDANDFNALIDAMVPSFRKTDRKETRYFLLRMIPQTTFIPSLS